MFLRKAPSGGLARTKPQRHKLAIQTVQPILMILRGSVPLCETKNRAKWNRTSHKGTKAQSDRDDEFGVLITLFLRAFVRNSSLRPA